MNVDINEHGSKVARELHRSNSEQALQAIIELMLTDHSTAEVVAQLRTWAAYIEERS